MTSVVACSRLLITTQSVSNEHCLSLGHHLAILKLTLERFCRVTTHHRPFNPLSFASCLGLTKIIASKIWDRGKGLKESLPALHASCLPSHIFYLSQVCRQCRCTFSCQALDSLVVGSFFKQHVGWRTWLVPFFMWHYLFFLVDWIKLLAWVNVTKFWRYTKN